MRREDQPYGSTGFKHRLRRVIRRLSGSYNKTPWLRRTDRRTQVSVAIVFALVGIATASYSFASTPSVTNITINGNNVGPTFDGIGAISGGGGNSRLLVDYPATERSQILDYLFKPNYGANLQLLKLEIGGDANSSDGSEASIEHSQGQVNCNSGYEWWVAQQAVVRNPNIKLYGLQWAAPGWTGNGTNTIWTTNNVNYVIDWMNCAKSHGLTVSYLGGWNERGYNASWYESLRSALNSHGYTNTTIVAADNISNPWGIATALSQDAAFKQAVGVVGVHDTCPVDPTTGYSCSATTTAGNLGLPLWESELGGMDANYDAASMVRAINNGYNQAGITGYLEWPVVDSMPSGLPYENRGLLTADQPWSGNYVVNLMTWAIAQTTQFTQPGWVHVGSANNTIGNSGTYNTYESPDHSSWSLVAENTSSYTGQVVTPQTIHVNVSNLPSSVVHVWQTNLWIHSSSPQWFSHQADIHPVNGVFSYTIQPGTVVTFTTTSGQSKGNTSIPAAKNMSLPYSNTLASNDGSNEAALLSPQDGSFEIAPCLGGIGGSCTQQMATQLPVLWGNSNNVTSYPYAIVGDNWTNYTVSVKVLFQRTKLLVALK